MKRQLVISSNIESIGYENGILEVEFRSGSVYQYHDVPKEVFDSILSSESIGKAVNSSVIKAGFKHEKVLLDKAVEAKKQMQENEKVWPRYRKKPVEIEAVRFTRPKDITEFCPKAFPVKDGNRVEWFQIKTLEGNMRLNRGEWLIKGVQGEFYPCQHNIFEQTYEKV